ncbi:hypothetical protein ACEPAI_1270 [Sanghuangporus weigelae]
MISARTPPVPEYAFLEPRAKARTRRRTVVSRHELQHLSRRRVPAEAPRRRTHYHFRRNDTTIRSTTPTTPTNNPRTPTNHRVIPLWTTAPTIGYECTRERRAGVKEVPLPNFLDSLASTGQVLVECQCTPVIAPRQVRQSSVDAGRTPGV